MAGASADDARCCRHNAAARRDAGHLRAPRLRRSPVSRLPPPPTFTLTRPGPAPVSHSPPLPPPGRQSVAAGPARRQCEPARSELQQPCSQQSHQGTDTSITAPADGPPSRQTSRLELMTYAA